MSALFNYENHLFISYAHIDNYHYSGAAKGWIDLLHENLEIRLSQLLGKKPTIWRDRKLKGNDVFYDTIDIELSKTAILLSIISPRYVQSSSCRQELGSFFRLASQDVGVRLDDKHRVFKVVKTYVPFEDHPPEIRDLLGYEFYQCDQASGRVREFDQEIRPQGEKDKRFWDKFEDLVWDIMELIKRIESSGQPPATSTSGATIFLAETTSDLSEERDKVKRELQQYGHLVLPDKPLPWSAPALREAVRQYLNQSRLSVHLIGEHYGVIPEMETERSIVRLQQEMAIERGDTVEFSRLIWMPPDLQPKDELQRKFVVDLQNSFFSQNGSELLQVKLEDLKTIIQVKLTQKLKPAYELKEQAGAPRIYLICDQQDVDAVELLQNHFLNQGWEMTLPLFDGNESEVLTDHKENLLLCDAVLIYYGRASEGWLRMKLRDLIKLPGYGRTSPLAGKAVYIGAPESPSKERFKTLEAQVIKNYGEFDPAALAPFLAQINKAKGA
ncbi:MAG TPA: DUF4062 domain-containing protein [Blastocatellia bacterium]|nr:DUF4062 domain-containing protein [Blastocatellia bacterium]